MIINFLCKFFATCSPVILGGIANMLFVRTNLFKNNSKSIDGGYCLKDGRPLFGENKTYLGLISMVVLTAIIQVIWGGLIAILDCEEVNLFYNNYDNNLLNNLWIGALLGLFYMTFELPNSFIKRRLDINPGKTNNGIVGRMFGIIDQIDSLIGIAILMSFTIKEKWITLVAFVLFGGIIHIVVNSCLYRFKIRKNV